MNTRRKRLLAALLLGVSSSLLASFAQAAVLHALEGATIPTTCQWNGTPPVDTNTTTALTCK